MKEIMKSLSMVIIFTLLLGIGTITPVNAQGEVSVSIDAPAQVEPGSDFTATVTIGEVADLNAVQYDVSFNSSVLRLDNITSGQIGSKEMAVMSNEVSAGTYRVVQSLGLGTVDGSGSLAVLHFHALESGNGSTTLSNGVLAGMGGEIGAEWAGSSVTVGSQPPPYSPPTSNPPPTPPTSSPTPPDIQQPNVASTLPATGAVRVPVAATVKAAFDKAMDSTTITTGSFSLRSSSAVSGTVSYDASTKTATFTPDANLEWGARYTATLSSSITDTAGNKFTGISWSFTTEQKPAEDAGNVAGVPAVEDGNTPDEVPASQASNRSFTGWAILGAGIFVILVLFIVIIRIIRRRSYYGY